MQNELSDKAWQHLILVVFSFLDVHNVFNFRFKWLIFGLFELSWNKLLSVYEIVNNIF